MVHLIVEDSGEDIHVDAIIVKAMQSKRKNLETKKEKKRKKLLLERVKSDLSTKRNHWFSEVSSVLM